MSNKERKKKSNSDFKKDSNQNKNAKGYYGGDSKRAESNKYPRKGNVNSNVTSRIDENDLGWYVPDAKMALSVSNIPFGYRTGDNIPYNITMQGANAQDGYTAVGVHSIAYIPTIGYSDSTTSPANLAAQAVYSHLRRFDSGAKVFDAVDMMMQFIAVDSVYSAIAWFRRLLAVAQTFTAENRYYPRTLIRSMGINPDSLSGKLNEVAIRLNYVINQIATIKVPATFKLYNRHIYLCSNLFLDEPTPKGQTYLFNPRNVYKFTYAQTDGKIVLEPIDWYDGTQHDWTYYMDILEDITNAMFIQQDCGIISASVEKAYGSNIFSLSTILADSSAEPKYDKGLLSQIHNMDIVTANPVAISQNVNEDSGGISSYIESLPYAEGVIMIQNKLLDLDTPNEPGAVMYATRLCNGETEFDGTNYKLTSVGTEYVVGLRCYKMTRTGDYNYVDIPRNVLIITDKMNSTGRTNVITASMIIEASTSSSSFPILYTGFQVEDGDTGVNSPMFILGSTNYTTHITGENIAQLNRVARLGLFDVTTLTLGNSSDSK